MPASDPNNFNLVTIAIAMGVAIWGGLANYFSRIRNGVIKQFSWFGLTVELTVSGFACLMVFLLCAQFEVSEYIAVFMGGMAGHSGAATIKHLDKIRSVFLTSFSKEDK